MRTTGASTGDLPLGGTGSMYSLEFLELLAVDLGVRAQEIKVSTQRLPFALLFQFLLGELVAFAFVDMKNVDLHVFAPARQIRKNRGTLAEIADHVAANITAEHGAGKRILEQDLDHLFYS